MILLLLLYYSQNNTTHSVINKPYNQMLLYKRMTTSRNVFVSPQIHCSRSRLGSGYSDMQSVPRIYFFLCGLFKHFKTFSMQMQCIGIFSITVAQTNSNFKQRPHGLCSCNTRGAITINVHLQFIVLIKKNKY